MEMYLSTLSVSIHATRSAAIERLEMVEHKHVRPLLVNSLIGILDGAPYNEPSENYKHIQAVSLRPRTFEDNPFEADVFLKFMIAMEAIVAFQIMNNRHGFDLSGNAFEDVPEFEDYEPVEVDVQGVVKTQKEGEPKSSPFFIC